MLTPNAHNCHRASPRDAVADQGKDQTQVPVSEAEAALQRLHSTDPKVRGAAAWDLRNFPEQAERVVPALVQLLSDSNVDVASSALFSLGFLGPYAVAAIPDLQRLAEKGQHPLNFAAHFALEKVLSVTTPFPPTPGDFSEAVPHLGDSAAGA